MEHPGRLFVAELLDNFMHTGPHGKRMARLFFFVFGLT